LFVECVRRWVRVAWVCRVSVASCVAGVALFLCTPQARDLLLEFPRAETTLGFGLAMARHAIWFGFLVLVFWALPVHAVARLNLNREEWLTSSYGRTYTVVNLKTARKAFETPAILLPRLFGLACFVAVALGIALSGSGLLTGPITTRVTTDSARFGLVAYLASVVGFAGIFYYYATRRRRWFERLVSPLRSQKKPLVVPKAPATGLGKAGAGIVGPIDRVIVWTVFFVLIAILIDKNLLNDFPRILLVPILLGAWVPLLGWLASRSFATRLPLIAASIGVLMLVTYLVGDGHDVHPKSVQGQEPTQIDIKEAVKAWRKANGKQCEERSDQCPSPIIVATSGGASRAAFMTASVLGLLLDATCFDSEHRSESAAAEIPSASRCAEPPAFGNRLFAISSVSGGSLGAVVYARAYADGSPGLTMRSEHQPDYKPPCESGRTSDLWFKVTEIRTWRDCMQAILSEDSLSHMFSPDWAFAMFSRSWTKFYPTYGPIAGSALKIPGSGRTTSSLQARKRSQRTRHRAGSVQRF
jgi:hypothetical protein